MKSWITHGRVDNLTWAVLLVVAVCTVGYAVALDPHPHALLVAAAEGVLGATCGIAQGSPHHTVHTVRQHLTLCAPYPSPSS